MNTVYNTRLFILHEENPMIHVFTKVLVGTLQKQVCLPITQVTIRNSDNTKPYNTYYK